MKRGEKVSTTKRRNLNLRERKRKSSKHFDTLDGGTLTVSTSFEVLRDDPSVYGRFRNTSSESSLVGTFRRVKSFLGNELNKSLVPPVMLTSGLFFLDRNNDNFELSF